MSKSPVATATLALAPSSVGGDCKLSTCCTAANGGGQHQHQHQIRLINSKHQSSHLVKPKRIRKTSPKDTSGLHTLTISAETGACMDFNNDKEDKSRQPVGGISSQQPKRVVISDTNDKNSNAFKGQQLLHELNSSTNDDHHHHHHKHHQHHVQTATSAQLVEHSAGGGQDSNNNDNNADFRQRQQQDDTDTSLQSANNSISKNNNSITTITQLSCNSINPQPSSPPNSHMPWFGIDVGGSLVKVVFFDPHDATPDELVTLRRIRRYLKSPKPYGKTGKLDTHLEMSNCLINQRLGSLHFIRFATNEMQQFLQLAKVKQFTSGGGGSGANRRNSIHSICATGGGACKFEHDIEANLGIKLEKTDEMDSIIYGIHYIDKYNSERECYWLRDPLDEARCLKVPYDFSRPYPYLVVNIGSGVSILAVHSSTQYSRVSGSPIGGGTFLGLCCLLTQCETFDEAIRLANHGKSTKVDKLVKDIYGGDYKKFQLSGETVASAFGHMNLEEKRQQAKREDLARALLEMVTINIGSLAMMCAQNAGIERVVFIGNFLRVNQLSMRLLSNAVNYWSKGKIKALFLEHEGYFGAVGCFVESTTRQGRQQQRVAG